MADDEGDEIESKARADEDDAEAAAASTEEQEIQELEEEKAIREAEKEQREASNAEKADKKSKKTETGHKHEQSPKTGKLDKLKGLAGKYWAKKKITIPATIVALLLIIFALPVTRYSILGMFIQKPVTISVVDSKTNTPVSAAQVTLAGKSFKTDGSGKATQKLKLGNSTLSVSKQYYQSANQGVMVTLSDSHNSFKVSLVATGRQVPVTVTDKITGKPLANASIKVLHTEAKTDKTGKAIIVLPIGVATQKGNVSLSGYITTDVTVQVTDQTVAANTFAITPSGKIYFLSNQSGKIDVVKTNLDGSDRQVVLAGTGNEKPYNTSLLASRDWKYLALLAQRKSTGNPEIDLIDTSNDTVSNIDEGDATFTLVGWDNDRFVYEVNRNSYDNSQNNKYVLKSFNAPTKALTVLAQSSAIAKPYGNFVWQELGPAYLQNNQVVYSFSWYGMITNGDDSTYATLNGVRSDGTGKTVIKNFGTPSINTVPYDGPNNLLINWYDGSSNSYHIFEYEDGKVSTTSDITPDNFYNNDYPTFLLSPSGKQTFWSDQRDGKNALFIGDADGKNQKQIGSLTEYTPYGWYSDNYTLVSKNGSELYILAADGSTQPRKITDYYKPPTTYRGYGGGYGGY